MKRLPRPLVAAAALVAVATAAAPGWRPYVIKPGDTLWDLARTHHTSVQALQQQNHLDGSLIIAGQTIDVPGNGAPAKGHTTTVRTPAQRYAVHDGDTLTSIARSRHTTVAGLVAANDLTTTTIYVGQQLTIPGTAGVAQVFTANPASPAYAKPIAESAQKLAATANPSHAQVRAMVAAEATRQGVDPALAVAIADQESGFSQRMVSATNAVGVMQLMATTASWLADYTNAPLDRYQVADNIRGGVTLLRILRTQASVSDTIAGYYQGIASVRSHGMYDDTKQYVASVTALMRRGG